MPSASEVFVKALENEHVKYIFGVPGEENIDFLEAVHVEPVAEAKVDFAVLVGEEMRSLARELGKAVLQSLHNPLAFAHCDSPDGAIELLEDFGITAGDAVLVKGSNSVGLGKVVAHFTGRED